MRENLILLLSLYILCILQVDRTATPPVCKIYDYHREKYLIRLKEKERSKSKVAYFLTTLGLCSDESSFLFVSIYYLH